MKTIISIAVIAAFLFGMTSSTQIKYPTIESKSFKSGEKLRYRITYGVMDAGEAVLTVNETSKKVQMVDPSTTLKVREKL